MAFTLRISITGLILLAVDGEEVYLLFPKTGDEGLDAHDPFLAHDAAYHDGNAENLGRGFCQHPLHGRAIDWRAASVDDPRGDRVPDSVLSVSRIDGNRPYPRTVRQGNGNSGRLVSRVALRAGGIFCHQPGNYFMVNGAVREACWIVQWAMTIDNDSFVINTKDLSDQNVTPLVTLHPINNLIDVVFWQVPRVPMAAQPDPGTPVNHFRAIYRLLERELDIPTFHHGVGQTPLCNFALPHPRQFGVANDAFQCFPGAVILGA